MLLELIASETAAVSNTFAPRLQPCISMQVSDEGRSFLSPSLSLSRKSESSYETGTCLDLWCRRQRIRVVELVRAKVWNTHSSLLRIVDLRNSSLMTISYLQV